MANIKSFPNNQDEYVGAEHVMRWLHGRTSGVFGADGNAAVAPVLDAMAVTVSDGNGWISNDNADGVVWWIDNEAVNGSKLQLPMDMADAVLPRIDRVVVSWQTTNYVALPEVSILKGIPASNPVAPALTNNNILRQISLGAIRIPAGVTAITADMITDERLDDSVCGLVTCGISVDTSVMQAQWTASYADFLKYLENQQDAWDAFFQNIQNDTVFPVPGVDDIGKPMVVNANGDGYSLGTEEPFHATLLASGWIDEGYRIYQRCNIAGLRDGGVPFVDVELSGLSNQDIMKQTDEEWAKVYRVVVSNGAILAYASGIPTVDLPFKIKVVR